MLLTYLVIAFIVLAYTFYYAGQWERPGKGVYFQDTNDIIKTGVTAAFFWPFLLVIGVIIGPFIGFYYLGERKRKKIKAKKAVDNNT